LGEAYPPSVVNAEVGQWFHYNPIWFYLPGGTQGRVWLDHYDRGTKVIDDERAWRCHLSVPTPRIPAPKCEYDAYGRHIPSFWRRKPAILSPSKQHVPGFKVYIGIEGEKELQVLGCGWRIVTCHFRGNKVLLHAAGQTATMKRKAFKELVEATPTRSLRRAKLPQHDRQRSSGSRIIV
jgi:hypothetical protein